jgi:hypothetical protein
METKAIKPPAAPAAGRGALLSNTQGCRPSARLLPFVVKYVRMPVIIALQSNSGFRLERRLKAKEANRHNATAARVAGSLPWRFALSKPTQENEGSPQELLAKAAQLHRGIAGAFHPLGRQRPEETNHGVQQKSQEDVALGRGAVGARELAQVVLVQQFFEKVFDAPALAVSGQDLVTVQFLTREIGQVAMVQDQGCSVLSEQLPNLSF